MFYADLHVHSKHSRATSQDCDLEHLYYWARKKGIAVVGTGDFTHPAWMAELREKLVPAEPGLFRLREDLERVMEERLQTAPLAPTRFMLSVEISNIYKRADKTRKIHNLIYAPDLDSAARFSAKLSRIGNIASDGRPILGLDSRDLLEIALESGEGCYLVPAHIWTPWFAVLGSKSGFDAVEDCFADLAHHVFAVETGLSSDPAMNWRLSSLDRYRLVSSSDAHSPAKLGREATRFDTELDYFALRRALETGEGFGGTVEFFPEEGKYHLDGHRKCNVCLLPQESRAHEGRCPACGKPLTLGVLHRIEELADRPDGAKPEGAAPFDCLVPLAEVLAETLEVGRASQKVQFAYERMLSKLGPELHILKEAPIEDVERRASPVIAEAIARMRAGKVFREAGYDGEYGVIRMFEPGELAGKARLSLFEDAGTAGPRRKREQVPPVVEMAAAVAPAPEPKLPQLDLLSLAAAQATPAPTSLLDALDPEQRAAAATSDGPLLIIAGPGTGKTRTLTHRIAHLVRERGVAPDACLAITFTRRAAGEMRERLHGLLGDDARAIHVATFHALGAAILREHAERAELPSEVRFASERERLDALMTGLQVTARDAAMLIEEISRSKRTRALPVPGSELAQATAAYTRHLRADGLVDFDDLVAIPVGLLERDPELAAAYRARYRHVSIDEYQDIDELQYRLVRLLAVDDAVRSEPASLCAIGDPDQAIYSFRGADVSFFTGFRRDFPAAQVVQLTRNYRSGASIVEASAQVIRPSSLVPERRLEAQREERLKIAIHDAASDRAEAEFIVRQIEALIGGYSFHAVDSGRLESGDGSGHVFSDFAVLYRTSRQLEPLEAALSRAGIPFQRRAHTRLLEEPFVQAIAAALEADAAQGSVHAKLVAAARAQPEADPVRREAVLAMLGPLALRAGDDCARFLADLAAGTEIDTWDPRADRVSLLTLHAAKGLEFDVVFVAGCEDGVIPLRFGDDCDLAEERRLFFVGMTRARRRLVLSHARKRLWQGQLRECAPSPFLRDIEQHLLERSQTREQPVRRAKTQLDLF